MLRNRLRVLVATVGAVAIASACSEKISEGHACPALCPNQNVPVHDTTIDGSLALDIDTTVTGYPALGTEPELLVATRGDTLDVRGVIRFDSIPYLFRPTSADTLRPAHIAYRPYVRLRFDTTAASYPAADSTLTFHVYDVDTVGNDTTVAVLASLFRPDRLLGSGVLVKAPAAGRIDSLRIPLDSGLIAAHVRGDKLVRIGIRLVTTGRIDIRNVQAGFGLEPAFSYRPSTDTVHVPAFTAIPRSTTPASNPTLATNLATYPLIVIGSSPPIGQRLDIGGVPARRVYVRFHLPPAIIDSATVLRATLTLRPVGLTGFLRSDSLTIFPQGVIATADVTDPTRAALFVAPASIIGIDTVRLSVTGLDSVNLEFANAVRRWSGHSTDSVSRAIVLRIASEGANPLLASFFSSAPSVPATQHPHVHLSYVTRVGFGLP